ncbi:pyridoxamine 5'-phosphate oxidase family protein [Phenylobacterium sp.]|uniref:pyridoxamine 5'-phosphate oxidase family protein n=1 Tax=Phenylobacterium sp. TaxID=1871053 RepID=UPI0025F06EF5|nr:pyridoxamine 5'-phosphate oxidase family protein [Phenylobacterium sp.]MBX3484385.1 pyridoxamine 5'-phosphate oxidase family protein [Phenylobacterium sp.]MCW5758847.1 pyridoxamine 5'-phosphate oxidase family protein [Phenylobacterium sp.]
MTLSDKDVQDRLWSAVEDHHTGMLGLLGDRHHFQPMTAFVERDTNTLWFFTRNDTDLARAIDAGAEAAFIFTDRKLQACIDGRISLDHDRARIDRYWNAHVAAWYPDGKDDPTLTLLKLDVTDAAVWITEGGLLKYAFELAKANAGKTTPDVGERRDLNFH